MVDEQSKETWSIWVLAKAVWMSLFDIGFTLVSILFFNWWVVYFAHQGEASDRNVVTKGPVLPNWLTWFQTFDATLDRGIQDGSIEGPSGFRAWRQWLNRNPGYGFSYWVLGTLFYSTEWREIRFQDADFSKGIELDYLAMTPDGRFNIHKTFWLFGLHLRLKWGWKAWNMRDITSESGWNKKPWGPEFRIPFVFSLSKAE